MAVKERLPDVAILVVNWNRKKDILNLLSALERLDYGRHEIFIVDNASTDGSVEAVMELYPGIKIIRNEINLGGTGGFNKGLQHILQEQDGKFEYVWLLDNDALVDALALRELVNVAELDKAIGIAGSKIMNPDNPDIIVEMGAFIDWKHGHVKPFMRNTGNREDLRDYYDVDYVAVCSALVRTDALKRVGCMDERYFIFWDDMDWGITFKRHGYRVVAVNRSVVYHPAFTEKNKTAASYYYARRNPLLTFSKHAGIFYRVLSLFQQTRKTTKKICFLLVAGKPELAKVYLLSIIDFLRNKWGKYDHQIDLTNKEKAVIRDLSVYKRFIVTPQGDKKSILKIIQQIRQHVEEPYIALLIQSDRLSLFSGIEVDEVIPVGNKKRFGSLNTLITLLWKRFDIAVAPPEGTDRTFGSLSYAVRDILTFEEDKNLFRLDQSDGNPWKIVISYATGELTSLIVFPFIFLGSLRYRAAINQKI